MKFLTLFHTIRFLKPIQVYARGLLYLKQLVPKRPRWELIPGLTAQKLLFNSFIPFPVLNRGNKFRFLNLEKDFGREIDWNFMEYGRLWTYNLNYFEYLNQEESNAADGKKLICTYILQIPDNHIGLEPYPLSLRCMNWIRFLVRYDIKDPSIDSALFRQLDILTHKLEYHLLGNHLLENAFALFFGYCYFNNLRFYRKAKQILFRELEEQILPDGGHFELSPMYHNIILLRLLDCYNLISNNDQLDQGLRPLLKEKCEIMMGWMHNMTFRNGNFPLMNDAAYGIAPTSLQINEYGLRLGIKAKTCQAKLKESGYRKFENGKFEMIMDVGHPGPNYQPGHAHADTFSFELHVNGRPVIIDTGTSTYEVNETRFYERSTAAHNTVVAGAKNSSEVWAGHRVARRAKVTLLKDTDSVVSASHNGYKTMGTTHHRRFEMLDEEITITDILGTKGTAYLHFAPDEKYDICDKKIHGKDYVIEFEGNTSIEEISSLYAPEFNKRLKITCLCIHFQDTLTTTFK